MKRSTQDVAEPLFRFVKRLPFNIAPERGDELASRIFGKDRWTILPQRGIANFSAVVEERILYLRYSGLCSLWCVAYASFHIRDIGTRERRRDGAATSGGIDIEKRCEELNLSEYIDFAKALISRDCFWPSNLMEPDVDANIKSVDGEINNVFYGALSWIMLHEIGHVYHGHDECAPPFVRIKQEYEADDFATKRVLDCAGTGLEREFRVLMICVALAWLFILELERGQGTTHPPTILRFRETKALFNVNERSVGLENAVYVMKYLLDPGTPMPPSENSKGAFDWIANRLEQLYPIRA